MKNTFTAIFEKTDNWYIAYVEELPGVNSQGKTLEEARDNLKEAVELILITNRELSEKESKGKEIIKEELFINV